MKLPFAVLLLSFLPVLASAQTTQEQEAIMKPVNDLFRGMKLGDSSLVRSAFAREVTMASVMKNKEGKTIVRNESSIDGFATAVGTPHDKSWNEMIWNTRIQVDGDFAQVWCDYAFYLEKEFLHCGVDAFHLYKTEQGWKIFHLADTRRTTGCEVPSDISKQFK